jgi:hypothetical protein
MKPWAGVEAYFALVPWAVTGGILLALQILFMAYYNNFWAEGNILLLIIQVFTFVQFADSILLMWDEPSVMYNIVYKILRYIFLAMGIVFNFVYILFFINLMTLVYSGEIFEYTENFETVLVMRSDLTDEDTWAIYDIFSSMITTYFLISYAPTFTINLVIMSKEAMSDQFTFGWEEGDD